MRRRTTGFKKNNSTPNPFLDAVGVYSLRKIYSNWTSAVIRIERSSDNANAYVFFDGNTITLNSLISTSSNTTPSVTTLSAWLGSDDAICTYWYLQKPDNTVDTTKQLLHNSTTPSFAVSGVINLKNSKPVINFASSDILRTGISNYFTELNTPNSFTILTVSNNDVLSDFGGIIDTSLTIPSGGRFTFLNDNRTNKVSHYLTTTTSTYVVNTITQQNTTNQKLLTAVKTSSNSSSYLNGTFQATENYFGNYINDTFAIGRGNAKYLTGGIQEIAIFPSDKTANLSELHANINAYYSIY